MKVVIEVLLKNTKQKECKGEKLADRWLGPYVINCDYGKEVLELKDMSSKVLKKKYNSSHLKGSDE